MFKKARPLKDYYLRLIEANRDLQNMLAQVLGLEQRTITTLTKSERPNRMKLCHPDALEVLKTYLISKDELKVNISLEDFYNKVLEIN